MVIKKNPFASPGCPRVPAPAHRLDAEMLPRAQGTRPYRVRWDRLGFGTAASGVGRALPRPQRAEGVPLLRLRGGVAVVGDVPVVQRRVSGGGPHRGHLACLLCLYRCIDL
jgi:hypothetical protein